MSNYTDEAMKEHEILFWINHFTPPLYHEKWYKEFFPFSDLNGKVIEIGCGGYPISEYNDLSIDLTLVDPILNDLVLNEKYRHLHKYKKIPSSILDLNVKEKYDHVVCLNVIDHFNDTDYKCIDVFSNLLEKGGELWLYYDIRPVDSHDHKAIDGQKIMNKILQSFDIVKIDETINPTHKGWSGITSSVRVIAKKI